MSTSTDIPLWRATLLAVPPNRRSPYQHNLIRGLELADFIKDEIDASIDLKTNTNDARSLKFLAAAVEAFLLGPYEFSGLEMLDSDTYKKLKDIIDAKSVPCAILFEMRQQLASPQGHPAFDFYPLPVALVMLMQAFLFIHAPEGKSLIYFDEVLEGLKSENWDEMDRQLASVGSCLTAATLRDAFQFAQSQVSLKTTTDFKAAKRAVKAVIPPLAQAPPSDVPQPWKIVSVRNMLDDIVKPFIDASILAPWGVERGSREEIKLQEMIFDVTTLYITSLEWLQAAAEAEGDNGMYSFASSMLLRALAKYSVKITPLREAKALAEKAITAFEATQHWLPKTHRFSMNVDSISEILAQAPEGFEILSPVYLAATGKDVKDLPEGAVQVAHENRNLPLRTCGWCGKQSWDLLKCAKCKSAFYDTKFCQRMHWKNGHKQECAALAAQAQGAGGGGGVAAATAAPAAGPSAGPSGSQ